MSTTDGHSALRENLAAFALGALDDAERAELEDHLGECSSCRAELRWLSPAVDVLPASVDQHEPPKRLKRDLMSVVEREARQREREARGSEPSRLARFGGIAALRPALGLVAAIVLVAGVTIGILLPGSPSETETRVYEGSALSAQDEIAATFEVTDEVGMLHVRDAPDPNGDRVFQVWIQRGDTYEPSSTFVPLRDGSAEAAINEPLDGADGVLVTEEPRGGSRSPTTSPILEVPLGSGA